MVWSGYVLRVSGRLLLDRVFIWLRELWVRHVLSSSIDELHDLSSRVVWPWLGLLLHLLFGILFHWWPRLLQQLSCGNLLE